MAGSSSSAGAPRETLEFAIQRMAALREEHRPIVAQIAADAGMAAETRAMLLEHLREEEDARLAQIAALAKGTVTPSAPTPQRDRSPSPSLPRASASAAALPLTVGSLRKIVVARADAPRPNRVGSLRPR